MGASVNEKLMKIPGKKKNMSLRTKNSESFLGVATIVQGDSFPMDFFPMTQLSKETIVQWDFCPRKLLPLKGLLKLIFFIFYWK